MKQKFLLVGLMFLFSLFSFAQQSGTCGDNLKWTLVNGMLSITGTGTMTNYDDFTNTPWYMNIHSIETLYVYHGVKSIGKNAFAWCNSLTSVTLPSSVIYIGEDAFNSCWKLKSITIPYGVESIGNGAFANCTALESVDFPEAAIINGFAGCTALSSFHFPAAHCMPWQASRFRCRLQQIFSFLFSSIGFYYGSQCSLRIFFYPLLSTYIRLISSLGLWRKLIFGDFKVITYFCSPQKGLDSLAQLVEHSTFNAGVLGSSPKRVTRTKNHRNIVAVVFCPQYQRNPRIASGRR